MLKTLWMACALLTPVCMAQGSNWPVRPITMVLPFPAGGGADNLGRAMADEMGKSLGQPVIVVNRPGASGMLGTSSVAKAAPDGYTILFTSTLPVMTSQFLYAHMNYDVQKELAFVSQVATSELVLAVHHGIPVRDVKELIAWAGRNKGKASYGSWSVGSYPHLAGAHFSRTRELDMVHVAYKGEAPMLQDLISGQIPMAIATLGSVLPYIESGKLRPLAVTGHKRASGLPDVPTFAQAGLTDPEFKPYGWLVLMAPAQVPPSVLERLEKVSMAAVNATSVKARLQVAGMISLGTSARQFRSEYEEMMPILERVVKATGARLD